VLNKALLPIVVILAAFQPAIIADATAPAKDTVISSNQKPAAFYFDFLGYRYDLHRRVISRWEGLVRANRENLRPSKILVKYYINANGAISAIESTQSGAFSNEKPNERKLAEYALALENEEPVPFPETVSNEFPKGFFYQISLSIR